MFNLTEQQKNKLFSDLLEEEDDEINPSDEKLFAEILTKNLDEFTGIKRGDLISMFEENRYRNDGVFIYDGNKVVELGNQLLRK